LKISSFEKRVNKLTPKKIYGTDPRGQCYKNTAIIFGGNLPR
jgi:hypothetical protein